MKLFRFFLVVAFVTELVYTIIAGSNYGWNFFSVIIESIGSLTWLGQFNLDFAFFLTLTGLWLAWRKKFNLKGIITALFTLVGGILFVSVYLFIVSLKTNNIKELLTGEN